MTLALHLERATSAAQDTSAMAPAQGRRVAVAPWAVLGWAGLRGEQASRRQEGEYRQSSGLFRPSPCSIGNFLDPEADHP